MKIKKISLGLILYFITLSTFSQSVDLDRESMGVSYVRLPSTPVLDENYRTYSVDVNSSYISRSAYPSAVIEDKILIEGFEKVASNGTIDIQIQIGATIIDEVEIKKREVVKKDKEGNVTSRKTYYRPVISYSTNGSYYLKDHTENPPSYGLGSKRNTYKGSEYNSYSAASNYYKNNKSSLKSNFTRDFIKSIPGKINGKINYRYGYSLMNFKALLWILDSKKNEETPGHKKALADMQDAFSSMVHNEPVDAIKGKIEPIVAYFESVIPKFTEVKKKKHRKMRYASYYNIAQMYYYLDMPDKTIEYANKLIENDYNKRDGRNLIERAETLKKRFVANEINTRHFEVITTDNSNREVVMPIADNTPIEQIEDVSYYVSKGNLTEDNKIAKKSIKIIKDSFTAWSSSNCNYLTGSEYLYDASSRIVGQKFTPPQGNEKYYELKLIWENNALVRCEMDGTKIELTWLEGQAIKIKGNYMGMDYSIFSDDEGNVVKLEGNVLDNFGRKEVKEIEYNDGKISKVVAYANEPYKKPWIYGLKTVIHESNKVSVENITYKRGQSNTPENIDLKEKSIYEIGESIQ